ncbi:protein SufA [Escherichia coli]|nr:protein SufA [Escherichia coli]BDZ03651.1 protein SufA [Escherichia coli]
MDMHSGTFNPQDFAWQGLTLTPAAAIHIRELVAKQPGMIGVRLGVKQTGCAGFGYVLDSVSEPDKDDLLFEHDGAKLFVPLQAMPLLMARKSISFVKDLIRYSNFTTLKPRMNVAVAKALGYRRYYVS